jgi:hypothetical protein
VYVTEYRHVESSPPQLTTIELVARPQFLEGHLEPPASAMKASARGHGQASHDLRDLPRRQALPLREQQDLSIARPEPPKRLVNESAVVGRGRFLLRQASRRFEREPIVQREPPAARASLVRDDPSRRRIQPHAGSVAIGQLVETAPRGEEDLGHRILGVARRACPPAAVRDDVRAVDLEELLEAPLLLGMPHENIHVRQRRLRSSARGPSSQAQL